MNITQAEAISMLYKEMIDSIDHSVFPIPRHNGGFKWDKDDITAVYLEDGDIVVRWSRYRGCGESTTDETHHSLDSIFQ